MAQLDSPDLVPLHWTTLPAEIRDRILDLVLADRTFTHLKNTTGVYANVNPTSVLKLIKVSRQFATYHDIVNAILRSGKIKINDIGDIGRITPSLTPEQRHMMKTLTVSQQFLEGIGSVPTTIHTLPDSIGNFKLDVPNMLEVYLSVSEHSSIAKMTKRKPDEPSTYIDWADDLAKGYVSFVEAQSVLLEACLKNYSSHQRDFTGLGALLSYAAKNKVGLQAKITMIFIERETRMKLAEVNDAVLSTKDWCIRVPFAGQEICLEQEMSRDCFDIGATDVRSVMAILPRRWWAMLVLPHDEYKWVLCSAFCRSFYLFLQLLALPILDSILNPILEATDSILSGNGLVGGALGLLEEVLGVEQTFDYVIVGGGTAGNAIGVRLAEAGFSVAIIEARLYYEIGKPVLGTTPAGDIIGIGSSALDALPTVDWNFLTEPQAGANNREVHYARGKCLGGSSALNFMIHHRGSADSYQQWADMVDDQSYTMDALMPYFQKSVTLTPPNEEKRRENASTLYSAEAFADDGGPVNVGYTNWVAVWSTWLEKGMQAIGMERTTGFNDGDLMAYIYEAKDTTEENLKVYTQTLATKILFEDKKATGIEVNSLGINYKIQASREVIVSAGTFQSPQLLMVSGIGDSAALANHDIEVISDLPGVGQNMWDHIMFGPSYEVNFDTLDRVLHDPIVLADSLTDYILNQEGPLTSNVVEFLGWEKLPDKYRANFSQETIEALAQFPDDWPEVEHISGNGYIGDFWFPALQQPLDGKQYATILGAMVAPVSRGNISISSDSMFDAPLINPNWLTAKADHEVAVAWYRRMREVWHTDTIQEIVIGDEYWPGMDVQSDEEILDVIRDSLRTVWHAAGTCKMGRTDDKMAVVDSLARVIGVEGLRVVDASIMPILPPGHPQSTIYALAEKIAESIIQGS